MTSKVTPASIPVFVNPDGVNGPEGRSAIGWSVQGNAVFPGKGKTPVFSTPDGIATSAAASGWTAQSGCNQNLVASAGVI
jgi:hypothetical protein